MGGMDRGMDMAIFLCMLPTLLLVVMVTALLWRRAGGHAHEHARRPPGPRGLPVIGHLHLLGRLPHQSLYQLSTTYGPLMSLRFGSLPILVASSPATAKLLLRTHDLAFSARPCTIASLAVTHGANITFGQPDQAWRLKRQICSTQLLSTRRVQALKWIRDEEVGALLQALLTASCADSPVVIRPKLMEAGSNIICRMLFGKRFSELSTVGSQGENLMSLLNQAIELLGEFNISDYVPSIAWMDLQRCGRRSRIVSHKLRSALKEILDEHRRLLHMKASPSVDAEDLLQVLLSASSLTDDDIIGVLLDMFAGGTDTSTYTVEWALAELLYNLEKLKISQEEIDKVVGRTRRVCEEDIVKLPYLQAIVKETMRLHPVVPLLVPHVASRTCNLMGFQIISGTQAFLNVWAIGRDSACWHNPLEFMPERFLEESASSTDVYGFHFQLLPFGSGRRMCPGLSLGLVSTQILLASLLHCFEWTIPTRPNMSETFHLLTTMAMPLAAFPIPRLPLSCYS